MKVTLVHAASIGYCVKGMRVFAKKYDICFGDFARDGVDEEILLKTGDAMATALVDEARKWAAEKNHN